MYSEIVSRFSRHIIEERQNNIYLYLRVDELINEELLIAIAEKTLLGYMDHIIILLT